MENKFYQKWWFWVIIAVMIVGIFASLGSTSDYYDKYTECKQELTKANNQLEEIRIAWSDFTDALDEYCALDPYNNICIALTV